jgi:hypothetical protein
VPTIKLEDLLVALADKCWKGQRVDKLESKVTALLSASSSKPEWACYAELDEILQGLTKDADAPCPPCDAEAPLPGVGPGPRLLGQRSLKAFLGQGLNRRGAVTGWVLISVENPFGKRFVTFAGGAKRVLE